MSANKPTAVPAWPAHPSRAGVRQTDDLVCRVHSDLVLPHKSLRFPGTGLSMSKRAGGAGAQTEPRKVLTTQVRLGARPQHPSPSLGDHSSPTGSPHALS